MTTQRIAFPSSPWLRLGLLTLTAATALCLTPPARAESMAWTATSYGVSQDRTTGQFTRRGLALFPNGEVAAFTLQGQVTAFDPKAMQFDAKIVYTFEDGSTLRQEGSGRTEFTAPPRNVQQGKGRLVGGTGRFEGISGTTESSGRSITETDSVTFYQAEFTLPPRK
ncbi:MAG TPA: hypothetical protein PKC59_10840 [Burkholderiaceae bacterium]|nr:hypothetical protein [Burkholderiaceae bacterium]HMY99440.1 hypothetical protein [Burkholderiaceae bacterium]HNB45331.1 hypothetical protein [Burkholderiaceae bacterium]HNG80173.1 hypothetical protein [Burkholderiaceae bacterium]